MVEGELHTGVEQLMPGKWNGEVRGQVMLGGAVANFCTDVLHGGSDFGVQGGVKAIVSVLCIIPVGSMAYLITRKQPALVTPLTLVIDASIY